MTNEEQQFIQNGLAKIQRYYENRRDSEGARGFYDSAHAYDYYVKTMKEALHLVWTRCEHLKKKSTMKRFPKQPNQGGHWVLNYDELREVKHKAGPCDRYESEISLEAVEDVILALRSMGYIEVDSDV